MVAGRRGRGGGRAGAGRPGLTHPRPAAALIVRDQTELRLCERSGQRTASVLWPWINRNARVADLVRILTHLQLLRARDIITACERAAPEPLGPPGPRERGRPGPPLELLPPPLRLGLTALSFLCFPGHPPAPLLPPSATAPRPNSISAPSEAAAPSPQKLHSSASTLLSPGKAAPGGWPDEPEERSPLTLATAVDPATGLCLPLTGVFMKLFQAPRLILTLSSALSQALLPSSHHCHRQPLPVSR